MSAAFRYRFVVVGKVNEMWEVKDRKTGETGRFPTRDLARRAAVNANKGGNFDAQPGDLDMGPKMPQKTPRSPAKSKKTRTPKRAPKTRKVPVKRVIQKAPVSPVGQEIRDLIKKYVDLIMDLYQNHVLNVRKELTSR